MMNDSSKRHSQFLSLIFILNLIPCINKAYERARLPAMWPGLDFGPAPYLGCVAGSRLATKVFLRPPRLRKTQHLQIPVQPGYRGSA